ncbi:MAG: hypothetical protein CL678_00595 [Bdellovibrionaceae bacterium]|nr:hypothetical protein [Pseudobdellovibrionaceae bacterium]
MRRLVGLHARRRVGVEGRAQRHARVHDGQANRAAVEPASEQTAPRRAVHGAGGPGDGVAPLPKGTFTAGSAFETVLDALFAAPFILVAGPTPRLHAGDSGNVQNVCTGVLPRGRDENRPGAAGRHGHIHCAVFFSLF